MTYKSIFKGRLEFGSSKSYEKVRKMYSYRVDNYYKDDVLFDEEEVFDEATHSLYIHRLIIQGSPKSWKNTVSLLEYVAQFAVAGEFGAWMTENGKILEHGMVEPKSDRAAVRAFLKGRDLSKEEGKEDEAIAELTKAIEKFDRHSLAYERRGRVNVMLKNYDDALYDYNKSIDLNPANTDAYYGRAIVHLINENTEAAIEDFNMAIKTSIPLQPIYWVARRKKAEAHLSTNDYKKALNDLKFYSLRKFRPGDENAKFQLWSKFHYGKALIEVRNYADAIDVFKQLEGTDGKEWFDQAEILYYKGLALKKSGKNGYRKDLKLSAKMGFTKASDLLKTE